MLVTVQPPTREPPTWLTDGEQRTWRALLAFVARLDRDLDRQLQQDAGMPHAYYMVLAMLSEAPGHRLRMSDLAEITASSPSRLSHAVARLEDKGWVRRERHPTDRRGSLAVLTEDGLNTVRAVAPGHVAAVRAAVFDRLTTAEVLRLGALFQALTEDDGGADGAERR